MTMQNEDRDRMLAEAWRDLTGWHVGMVTRSDEPGVFAVVTRADADGLTFSWHDGGRAEPCGGSDAWPVRLDIDSPANWGHWLAWAMEHGFAGATFECRVGYVFDFGCKLEDGVQVVDQPSFAHGLMVALCTYYDDTHRSEDLPPSVLAWWKAEQEATDAS